MGIRIARQKHYLEKQQATCPNPRGPAEPRQKIFAHQRLHLKQQEGTGKYRKCVGSHRARDWQNYLTSASNSAKDYLRSKGKDKLRLKGEDNKVWGNAPGIMLPIRSSPERASYIRRVDCIAAIFPKHCPILLLPEHKRRRLQERVAVRARNVHLAKDHSVIRALCIHEFLMRAPLHDPPVLHQ